MTVDDLALMALHAQSLYVHNGRGSMLTINEPGGGGPAPRLYFGRTAAGNIWRYRADLAEGLAAALEPLCASEPVSADLRAPPRHLADYVRLLGSDAYWAGPAYHFVKYKPPSRPALALTPDNVGLLRGGFDALLDELPAWQPFYAVVESGRAVSVCRSVRISSRMHEAGVETLPAYRGRGYATSAVLVWANAVRAAGAMATYSTSWDNTASQALAGKLGLRMYGADFHIA